MSKRPIEPGDRVEVSMFGACWLGTVLKVVPSGDFIIRPDAHDDFQPPIGQFEPQYVRRVTGCAATDLG